MAFGSFSRNIKVAIIGDTKNLERSLGRAETRLKKFGKSAAVAGAGGGLGRGSGGLMVLGRGAANPIALAAAAASVGLAGAARAAREAQVVMGQTGAAVDALGLDFQKNAKRIEDSADRVAYATAFDDEDVLRSFQTLVRQTNDVDKAFERVSLAADVARGRYVSLEQATQIVTKAGMGQVGALRRMGIEIRNGASATEALALLQKNYAGAAKQYSTEAAAATDRFKTALEGLAEEAGPPVLDFMAQLTNQLTGVIRNFDGLTLSAKEAAAAVSDPAFQKQLIDAFGLDAVALIQAAQGFRPSGPGGPGGLTFQAPPVIQNRPGMGAITKQLPQSLVGRITDARLSGNQTDLRAALVDARNFLGGALKDVRLQGKDKLAVKEALLGIVEELRAMDAAVKDAADRAAEDARDAAREAQRAAAEAARKRREAFKDAIRAQRDFQLKLVGDLKDKAMDVLSGRQEGIDTNRALVDAKEELRKALMIGGPKGIEAARRELQDAQLAREMFLLDKSTVGVAPGGPGHTGGYTITIGSVQLNNVQNVKQLIAELRKYEKTTAGQSRGRDAGRGGGV